MQELVDVATGTPDLVRLPRKERSAGQHIRSVVNMAMAPIAIKNERLPRTELMLSPLANILHTMSWMHTGQLEKVLTPSSPLVGLLQLLAWRDIGQLVCSERALGAFCQARSLLRYCGLKQALLPTAKDYSLDNCEACLEKLHGYCSGCVMCDNSLTCANCVAVVSALDLPMLPFPHFHRSRCSVSRKNEIAPVMLGDVLCLNCYPGGATEAQGRLLRLLHLYWDLSDGMWGLGAWRAQNVGPNDQGRASANRPAG